MYKALINYRCPKDYFNWDRFYKDQREAGIIFRSYAANVC